MHPQTIQKKKKRGRDAPFPQPRSSLTRSSLTIFSLIPISSGPSCLHLPLCLGLLLGVAPGRPRESVKIALDPDYTTAPAEVISGPSPSSPRPCDLSCSLTSAPPPGLCSCCSGHLELLSPALLGTLLTDASGLSSDAASSGRSTAHPSAFLFPTRAFTARVRPALPHSAVLHVSSAALQEAP